MNISEKGVCSICDEVFDDSDLTEINSLFLCSKDLIVYQKNDWIPLKETKVSNSNMNDALILQNMKDDLKKQNKPSYILSKYQESTSGEIETISTLYTLN